MGGEEFPWLRSELLAAMQREALELGLGTRRWRGHGRSTSASTSAGMTPTAARPRRSSPAASGGRPTAGSGWWPRWPSSSAAICPTSLPTCDPGSPALASRRSTPSSSGGRDCPRLPQPGALQDCHLLSQWMGSTAPHTQPGRAIFSSLVLQRPEPHNPPVDITIESCKDEKDEDKEWGG